MKRILLILLSLIPYFLHSQSTLTNTKKGAAIIYTYGAPTVVPRLQYDSEWAIDMVTSKAYRYNRTISQWQVAGSFVGTYASNSAPTTAPQYAQPSFLVNNQYKLFYWTGATWVCINCSAITTVFTDATLTGDGSLGLPLSIAQQGALNGQVLKWNGATWLPDDDIGVNYEAGDGITISNDTIYAIDISPINELQYIDSLFMSNDTLFVSLDRDSVAASFVKLEGLGDGNGIYSGSGTIPDSTYAYSDSSKIFALGQFPSFPSITSDGTSQGLYYRPSSYVKLINGDNSSNYKNQLSLEPNIVRLRTETVSPSSNVSSIFESAYSNDASVLIVANSASSKYGNLSAVLKSDTIQEVVTLFQSGTNDSIGAAMYLGYGDFNSPYYKLEERAWGVKSVMLNEDEFHWIKIRLPGTEDTTGNNIQFYEKYVFPNDTPSTVNGDTSVIVWAGTGSATSPLFIPFSSIGGSGLPQTLSIDSITGGGITIFTVSISDGNSINFNVPDPATGSTDTSGYNLTFLIENDTLKITDGDSTLMVSLEPYLDNTDTSGYNLGLYISGDTLYVQDATGTVAADLSSYLDNTDTSGYNISFNISNDTLYLIDGNGAISIDLGSYNNPGTDTSGYNLSLSISNDTLHLVDGNGQLNLDLGYLNNSGTDTSGYNSDFYRSNDTLYIVDGNSTLSTTIPLNTDNQILILSNDTLYIEDGNNVYLGNYLDNTDSSGYNQVLTVSNDTIYLTDGNSTLYAVLPPSVSTDTSGYNQNFLISGDSLFITDGNSTLFVELSNYLDNTDTSGYNLSFTRTADTLYLTDGDGVLSVVLPSQTVNTDTSGYNLSLSIISDSLSIVDGSGELRVNLDPYLDNTDTSGYNQSLVISGDTLYLTDGNSTLFTLLSSYLDNTDTSGYNISLSLSNDTLYVADGNSQLGIDLSGINTDTQDLSIDSTTVGNTETFIISLTDGGNVSLDIPQPDGIGTDTSGYNLSFTRSSDTLYLTDGNGVLFVVLPQGTVDTDDQTLSLSNDTLYIQDGNNVYLGSYLDNTDTSGYNQVLNISGDTLYITDGNGTLNVPLSPYLDNTDAQTLSVDSTTVGSNELFEVAVSGGNSVFITVPQPDGTGTDTSGYNLSFTLTNDTLHLVDGNGQIDLKIGSIDTDAQTLTVDSTTVGNIETFSVAISNGNTVFFDIDNTDNDNQKVDTFEIVSNILRLSLEDDAEGFKSVDLSSYLDNTDAQTLSVDSTISGSNELFEVVISNGNSVFITVPQPDGTGTDTSGYNLSFTLTNDTLHLVDGDGQLDVKIGSINTDAQTLTIDSTTNGNIETFTIDISGGNSINFDVDNTDLDGQTLSLSNDTLYINGGNDVYLGNYLDNTDTSGYNQTLLFSNDTLYLTDGDGQLFVVLPESGVGTPFSAAIGYIESQTGTTFDLDANDGVVKNIDGANLIFTIPSNLNNFKVFKNGIELNRTGTSTTRDYDVDLGTNTLTLVAAIDTSDRIIVQGITGSVLDFYTSSEFTGDGSFISPLTLAQQSAISGQVLKWNGSSWVPGNDNNTGTVYIAGTGITISGDTIYNASPDQTVTISSGTGINVTGTYPSFTVTNTVVNTDTQDLSIDSTTVGSTETFTISLVDGGSVSLDIPQPDGTGTDTSGYNQTLTLSNDTLYITDGNSTLNAKLVGLGDGNGVYSGSGTIDISGGSVAATLSNNSGDFSIAWNNASPAVYVYQDLVTPANSYVHMSSENEASYIEVTDDGFTLQGQGGLISSLSGGIIIDPASGSLAGDVLTSDGTYSIWAPPVNIYNSNGTVTQNERLVRIQPDSSFAIGETNASGIRDVIDNFRPFKGMFIDYGPNGSDGGVGLVIYDTLLQISNGLNVYDTEVYLGMNSYGEGSGIRIDTIEGIRFEGQTDAPNTTWAYSFPRTEPSSTPGDTSVLVWNGRFDPMFISLADIGGGGAQTLSIDSATVSSTETFTVSISGGNSVSFNVPQSGTDTSGYNQALSISGDTLYLTDGNSTLNVDLGAYSTSIPANEIAYGTGSGLTSDQYFKYDPTGTYAVTSNLHGVADRTAFFADSVTNNGYISSSRGDSTTSNNVYAFSGSLSNGNSTSPRDIYFRLSNLQSTTSSDAIINVFTGIGTYGDPILKLGVSSTLGYYYGIDNSDGDILKIGYGNNVAVGAGTVLMQMDGINNSVALGGATPTSGINTNILGVTRISGIIQDTTGTPGADGYVATSTGTGWRWEAIPASSDTSGYNQALTLSNDTLYLTDGNSTLNAKLTGLGDGNGIYTGDGATPDGGTTVDLTGDDPLIFDVTSGAGQVNRMLRLQTSYTADDAYTYFMQMATPSDSLYVTSFDSGIEFNYYGTTGLGTGLKFVSNTKLGFDADSIYMTTLPQKTSLPNLMGTTGAGVVSKLLGVNEGDVVKWDSVSGVWTTGQVTSSGGDILNGGNTTGAAVTIGTNDAFGLNFETNNVTRASITGAASTGGQWTLDNITANTATVSDIITLRTNSTGTATSSFGSGILFQGESSTTDNRDMLHLYTQWTNATDASRTSKFVVDGVNSGSTATFFTAGPSSLVGPSSTGWSVSNGTSGLTLGGQSGTVSISSTSTSSGAISIAATNNSATVGINVVTYNPTVNRKIGTSFESTFAPTSGNARFMSIANTGVINQTGGANGQTYFVYDTCTLTSAANYSSFATVVNSSNAFGVYQNGTSTKNLFAGPIYGGLSSGNDLYLRTTTNATKGSIFLADDGGEVLINGAASLGSPYSLVVSGAVATTAGRMYVRGSGSVSADTAAQIRLYNTSGLETFDVLVKDNDETTITTGSGEVMKFNTDGIVDFNYGIRNRQITESPTFATNNYTLVIGDEGKLLQLSNGATAGTLTVPTNASVAFPVGTHIDLIQTGSGQLTVTPAGGVTINSADSKTKFRVQYSGATLVKIDTNTWLLFGDISL